MATPIIMLVIMTAPWAIARVMSLATGRPFDGRGAGAIGLGLLFLFTGSAHFIQTESMERMLPEWVPMRRLQVLATGFLELAIAAGFFVPRWRRFAGWVAAALLVSFFPVNVSAALRQVPVGGHAWGPSYLLIRGPVQLAILGWVWWFTLRRPRVVDRGIAFHGGGR
jgi:uncharacterized membrane protein